MKLKYIPNALSVLRMLMILAFVMMFFSDHPNNYLFAALIYLIAGGTDVLDGYLARRFGWVSRLGKILDPVADKLLQLTVLICMGIKSLLPAWLIIPFIIKELTQLILGFLMIKKRNVVVGSRWYGKTVTVLMCASAVLVLIFAEHIDKIRFYVEILYFLLLICTVTAIILYIKNNINVRSETENKL